MIRTVTPLLTAGLALAALAPAQDPFRAGVRWRLDASGQDPWLPESVSFIGRDNLIQFGAKGLSPRLGILDRAAFGEVSPRHVDAAHPESATHVATAGGWGTDVFSAIQYPSPSKYDRGTFVARHDVVATAEGAPFAPIWVHDAGLITNGPARLASSRDGERVVLAVWDNEAAQVQLDFLDGETGALVQRVLLAGAALNELEVSDDGGTVVVAAGLDLYVLDGQGAQLHHEPLNSATRSLSLSGDGSALAVGGIGQLALLTPGEDGTWSNTFNALAGTSWIAAAVDLSHDGDVLAFAWWNYANGRDVRLDVWDLVRVQQKTSLPINGTPGGPQNLPEVVEVTPDGKHVALGTWGNGTWPEAIVLRPGDDLPLYGVDLPGSVRDLDLSDSGTRIAVAYKSTHNNVASDKGGVLLAETGFQSICQFGPASVGSDLVIGTRLKDAGVSFLLIGERAPALSFPGTSGDLLLDRKTLTILIQAADRAGRTDFALALPEDPSLIGTQLSMQAAWRLGSGTVFDAEVIDPLILD